MKNYLKPAFEVTIGSSFWDIIKSRTNTAINYNDEVLEIPIIKTLGLARTKSELKVHASGIIYEYLSQTTGAEITLGAVALPEDLVDELEGTTVNGGYTFNKTGDMSKEFAFGYWGENSDGTYMYYWHPVCKLVPADESHETKKDDIPEPSKEFKIIIIPYNGLWRVKYSTKKAIEAQETVISIDEFFAKPIYNETDLPTGAGESSGA